MAKKIKRQALEQAVDAQFVSTKEALEIVIAAITAKGQRKKIAENAKAKALLDLYGVEVE